VLNISDYSIARILYSGPHLSGWLLQYPAVFFNQWPISDVSVYMQSVRQRYISQGDISIFLITSEKCIMFLSQSVRPCEPDCSEKLCVNFHEFLWKDRPWDGK